MSKIQPRLQATMKLISYYRVSRGRLNNTACDSERPDLGRLLHTQSLAFSGSHPKKKREGVVLHYIRGTVQRIVVGSQHRTSKQTTEKVDGVSLNPASSCALA